MKRSEQWICPTDAMRASEMEGLIALMRQMGIEVVPEERPEPRTVTSNVVDELTIIMAEEALKKHETK